MGHLCNYLQVIYLACTTTDQKTISMDHNGVALNYNGPTVDIIREPIKHSGC